MEKTLVFIKAEVSFRPQVAAKVLKRFVDDNHLKIRSFRKFRVPDALAREHYAEHAEKHFFPTLLAQILAGPVYVLVLEGDGCIKHTREIAGATFVENANPGTIRADYGLYLGLNVIHASDSPESATREIALWEKYGGVVIQPEEALTECEAFISKWESKPDHTVQLRQLLTLLLDKKKELGKVLKNDALDPDITEEDLEKLVHAFMLYVAE